MDRTATKKIVLNGLMIALVFLATFFTKVPIPMTQGYFNIGDTVIIITAILLGRKSGLAVGAFGSMLADAAGGYYIFAPLTFVVKGLEGFIVGSIAAGEAGEKAGEARKILAVIAGALVMVAGYFIGEACILGAFDKTLGLTAALTELPLNLLQGGISTVVGYVLVTLLEKVGVRRVLES